MVCQNLLTTVYDHNEYTTFLQGQQELLQGSLKPDTLKIHKVMIQKSRFPN